MLGEIIKNHDGTFSVVVNEESGKIEVVKNIDDAEMISDYVLNRE